MTAFSSLGDLSRGLPPYEDECSSSSSFYVVSLHFLCVCLLIRQHTKKRRGFKILFFFPGS